MNSLRSIVFYVVLAVLPVTAREFQSTLQLKVFVRGSGDLPDRVIGFTPARADRPVKIPEGDLWYIRPSGALGPKKLHELAQVMKTHSVPGLDLSDHWELTDASMAFLKDLTALRMLDISRTRIADSGVAALQGLSRLSILSLPESVTDRSLEHVKDLPALRELNLDQARITNAGLLALTRATTLIALDLSSTRIDDTGVAALTRLPRLRRLVLGGLVSDACAPHLKKLQSMQEIDISQTQIQSDGLAALASLPHLKTIYVNRLVSDSGLKRLSASRSLRAIDLSRTQVTNEGIQSLAEIRSLEELALAETSANNDCLPFLARLPELRLLDLSETSVTSAGLAPLAKLRKLEVLALSWRTLSREDLRYMAALKQVKSIILNGVPMPEETMAQLKQLGTPSPWDAVAGLERARFRETKQTDQHALSAPVSIEEVARKPRTLPEVPKLRAGGVLHPPSSDSVASAPSTPTSSEVVDRHRRAGRAPLKGAAPSGARREEPKAVVMKPEPITSTPGKGASSSALMSAVTLNEASRPGSIEAPVLEKPREGVTEGGAPGAAVATKPETEDNLLQAITLQSNPKRRGAFSGLSGMRHFRQTQTVASLNKVSGTARPPTIGGETEAPEHFLGEISVGVTAAPPRKR